MAVNVSGLRRNLKNIAHNYSDAQVKVREATSNDPWGPSSTLMSEVAEMTYNVVAFTEIMQMVWKRLNDHGKNWRHVYKALVLLDYLIKNGNEKVAAQCKENIFAIQTLKDFQYFEDNKDQGMNVREKAKHLVSLLKDDDRLRSERKRAVIAQARIKGVIPSASGYGSDSSFSGGLGAERSSPHTLQPLGDTELEGARPQTAGEEELQLALALAMSREEADKEEERRKSDDVRLQLAISESQQGGAAPKESSSALVDLLDINLGQQADPWGMPQHQEQRTDAWGLPVQPSVSSNNDIWSGSSSSPELPPDPWAPPPPLVSSPTTDSVDNSNDPWSPVTSQQSTPAPAQDPWGPAPSNSNGATLLDDSLDDFAALSLRDKSTAGVASTDVFLLETSQPTKNNPKTFLGENSNLVNLENLVSARPTNQLAGANPFESGQPNPFQNQAPRPSINALRNNNSPNNAWGDQQPAYNPFLS